MPLLSFPHGAACVSLILAVACVLPAVASRTNAKGPTEQVDNPFLAERAHDKPVAEVLEELRQMSADVAMAVVNLGKQTPVDVAELQTVRLHLAGALTVMRREKTDSVELPHSAGRMVQMLRALRYTALQLSEAGYTSRQLRHGGYSASELKLELDYDACQLNDIGYGFAELLTAKFGVADVVGCGVDLPLLEELKNLVNLGLVNLGQLKEMGFGPRELKEADFPLIQILECDFNKKMLKEAYTVSELKIVLDACELKKLQYNAKELWDAGFSLKELHQCKFTCFEVKEFSSLQAQRGAGYTVKEVTLCGHLGQTIRNAGYSEHEMKAGGWVYRPYAGAEKWMLTNR